MWLVIAIVVFAFDAGMWRRLSHVRKKVLEVMPSFANFDAASTVSVPERCRWPIASGKHVAPAAMNLRAVVPVLESVVSRSASVMSLNKSRGLSFDVTETTISHSCDWGRISAAAFAQFGRLLFSHDEPPVRFGLVRSPAALTRSGLRQLYGTAA